MKAMRMSLALALASACCFTNFCPSLIEEEIKYPSPDGRFALRITQSKDDEYHPTVELIEKNSGKVMLILHSASDDELFDASESVLVWSADSKSVAYGFRASPPGARLPSLGALACFWNGSDFDKVFLPENLPSPRIKFPKGKDGNVKPYGGGVKPLRWLKSGDLEMSSEDMMLSRDDGKSYTGVLRFTVYFDAQHHPSVKKVGKTKTEVEG
jgi:hypothetical protein